MTKKEKNIYTTSFNFILHNHKKLINCINIRIELKKLSLAIIILNFSINMLSNKFLRIICNLILMSVMRKVKCIPFDGIHKNL